MERNPDFKINTAISEETLAELIEAINEGTTKTEIDEASRYDSDSVI